ncbi:MAG: flavin reductase [Deltaproteobacteria bacterium]|nr:flavin reductase [Deltaproteobacteria bacterium]
MSIKSGIVEAAKLVSHGVYVITTNHNGRVNGMTAAWVGRASFEPPLVTVAIGKTRFSHDMIKGSGIFVFMSSARTVSQQASASALYQGKRQTSSL